MMGNYTNCLIQPSARNTACQEEMGSRLRDEDEGRTSAVGPALRNSYS